MKKTVLERIENEKFLSVSFFILSSAKIVSGIGVGRYFLKKRLGNNQCIK